MTVRSWVGGHERRDRVVREAEGVQVGGLGGVVMGIQAEAEGVVVNNDTHQSSHHLVSQLHEYSLQPGTATGTVRLCYQIGWSLLNTAIESAAVQVDAGCSRP